MLLKTCYVAQSRFVKVLLVTVAISLAALGCASRKSAQQTKILPPEIQSQESSVIQLDNSRLSDALNEGDIPAEDRDNLSWLPQRPPKGMNFEVSSELQTVYFEFDKYSLTTETRGILDGNAAWLKAHPDAFIQIQGHCDDRGTLEYNQVLGENRAMNVKKYLVTLGIDPARLFTISYGETMPANPEQNEEAWAQNRRAEFGIGKR